MTIIDVVIHPVPGLWKNQQTLGQKQDTAVLQEMNTKHGDISSKLSQADMHADWREVDSEIFWKKGKHKTDECWNGLIKYQWQW